MFGQLVIGPPASGKSTYCESLAQVFTHMNRQCVILNLDPAADPPQASWYSRSYFTHPSVPRISITDLLSAEQAMDLHNLGPNGATLYCLAHLHTNIDWLLTLLLPYRNAYLIIDCPGQVETFTCHGAFTQIVEIIQREFRLCVVNLVDAHYCSDGAKFISVVMVSLKSMFMLGLPQVNVLSKVDLIESYGELAFDLSYYTQVQDLNYLLTNLDEGAFGQKYKALNHAIVDLIEDWGLVGFHTLCVHDNDNMEMIVRVVDKANGYVFGGLDKTNDSIFDVVDTGEV